MKIEKGVPVPAMTKYPFKDMEIGDSFFIENIDSVPIATYNAATRIKMRAAIRKEGTGYRVWRVA